MRTLVAPLANCRIVRQCGIAIFLVLFENGASIFLPHNRKRAFQDRQGVPKSKMQAQTIQ